MASVAAVYLRHAVYEETNTARLICLIGEWGAAYRMSSAWRYATSIGSFGPPRPDEAEQTRRHSAEHTITHGQ